MDRILLCGVQDEKFVGFLQKVGHDIFVPGDGTKLVDVLATEIIDLVIVDTRSEPEPLELCNFFRGQESVRGVPIIVLTDHRVHALKAREAGLEGVEFIEIPYSIGSLSSRVATALRLRKIAGADETSASLAEMNTALRDLNQKFAKELEEARTIQESLLPKSLPKDERFELAASYEPLDEVGGDWYYAFTGADEKLVVLIGDVTGHGLSAAFIGSMTKLAMCAADKEEPSELLCGMNRLMSPEMPDGKFVTMFCYRYDPASGEIEFARAGHLPGFLLRAATGEVEQLMGEGFALGFFDDGEYSAEKAQMEVGDVLIILSDAIPEGLNMSGETYGFERLSEALALTKSEEGVVEALTHIIQSFEEFSEGRILKDDVTLVALKRKK